MKICYFKGKNSTTYGHLGLIGKELNRLLFKNFIPVTLVDIFAQKIVQDRQIEGPDSVQEPLVQAEA